MSALARYFLASGKKVSGYDKTPTPLTDELIKEGAEIHFEDRPDLIPSNIDLVILTPAIPSSLNELHFVEKLDVPLLKRSEVLGEISKDKFTIAVAGTHGKTTISSMIAHIFKCANADFTAIIGGIATNYNSNFIGNKNGEILIVEADEFDRSFLTLYPDIAVISSVDADHLDIYRTKDSVDKSFQLFADQIKENGSLVLKSGLAIQKENKLYTYSLSDGENFKAISIEHQNEKFEIKFDLN
ncbi:MAG: UDP-N-acetylmuramate--L-alanine ligase, partial [Bacteroidetes bacterium]|nr:UDP-N-acetylmuramate--L-alanine ligase [Bacteroidota bacterium]